MSFFAPDPVVSGLAYRVISVDGSVPSTLEQFVGEVSIDLLHDGAGLCISGHGSAQTEGGVRFYEKNGDNAGKDVRIWELAEIDGNFRATSIAAF